MPTVRVATFNIRHGLGRDGRIDLERTAATIRRADPDLVALQELDRGMKRSGRADQPRVLEELTGLRVHFRPTLERGGGHYGLAVAARDPVALGFTLLPRREEHEERRGAITATWRGVTVIATHLSLRPRTRALQNDAIVSLAARAGNAIVAGDLNQQEDGLGPLFAAGFDPGPRRAPTLRTAWGWRRFDFVLAGPGVRHLGARTVDLGASDHKLVVATLDLGDDAAA